MLDGFATVVLVAVTIVNAGALAAAVSAGRRRLALLAVLGLWIGLAIMLGASGALLGNGLGPVPSIGLAVLLPLIAAGGAAALSSDFRRTLLELPTDLLIGLNGFRVLGFFFLLLALQHRLAGPFPYSAGLGDILTGILAWPVIASLVHGKGSPGPLARIWNWFGALDLIAAISLGVMSADGSPLQLIDTGIPGPSPMQALPWSLIPTMLVPLYHILHAIIHAQWHHRSAFGTAESRA